MSAPHATFESQDAIVFAFKDTDLDVDTSPSQSSDESVRRYVSQWFAADLKPQPHSPSLERFLAMAREREQFCRGANDLFGLGRCLGNQALAQIALGRAEEALALLKSLETLSRRIEDVEGLAFALTHQAVVLDSSLGQTAAALALAEQAQRLVTENHLSQLTSCVEPLLERIRARSST